MKEIHHLTLQDRQAIQSAIEEGKTKAEIGRLLGKDPCGISREIIRHREIRKRNTYNRKILCAKRKNCEIRRCTATCKGYIEPTCIRRDRLPGVCNGCEKRAKCPLDKYFYHAGRAHSRYREQLVSCREGINMEETERNLIGEVISPLLKQGQSVYQILTNHPELQLSVRTLYRYIETGVFKKFGVDNFSLKEQVSRRQFSGNTRNARSLQTTMDTSTATTLNSFGRILTFPLLKWILCIITRAVRTYKHLCSLEYSLWSDVSTRKRPAKAWLRR